MDSHVTPRPSGPTGFNPAARRIALADCFAAALVLLGLVGVALVLIARGGVFYSQWMQDLFIPLEGVLHLRAGQWPHRDFVTPVGSLWFVINALPGLVMPISARVLIWANLIVALVASSAALVVCLGKMPRWLAALAAFYIGLVALSPRQIGEDFHQVSNNASYNRICWALICVIALASLVPSPGASRRSERVDAVVAGLVIAACFYLKITYAAAGIGFLGLALVTARGLSGWRFVALAGSVALATVLAVAIVTGDLPGYFADMHTAVAVLPDTARSYQARQLLKHGLSGVILVGILALLSGARPGRLVDPLGAGLWAGLLTAVAGLAIGVQNFPEPENPLLPVALLVGWVVARAQPGRSSRIAEILGVLTVCAGLAMPVANDLCAVAWTMVAPVDSGPATRWLSRSDVTDLRIGAQFTATRAPPNPDIPVSDVQLLARWDEAQGLLRRHIGGRHDAIVLPFIWSNPFPLLLGLPPVRHEVAWWDPSRTFNTALKPDAALLLGPVDYVLVPRYHRKGDTTETMWAAYGARVQRDFRPADHSAHWDLWSRRDCARRSFC